MRPSRHALLTALPLICASLAATPAAADDIKFAEALLQRGWDDLAEQFCIDTEKNAKKDEVRARAGYTLYQIMQRRARASSKEEDFQKAQDYLSKWQKKYASSEIANYAGLDILLSQVSQAEAYMTKAQEATDSGERADLEKKAAELFQAVLKEFDKLTENLAGALEEYSEREIIKSQELIEKAQRRDLAEFLEIKALESYSNVLASGDPAQRKKVLAQAYEKAEFYYQERYSGFNLSRWCWGTLVYGQICQGLADASEGSQKRAYFDQAIELFEEIAAFKPKFLPEDPQARKQVEDFVKDVSLEAYFREVQALNAGVKMFSDPAYLGQAIVSIDSALGGPNAGPRGARWEGEKENFWARRLRIEKAAALNAMGNATEGLALLVDEVDRSSKSKDAKADWGGLDQFGVAACQKMAEIWESGRVEMSSRGAVLAGRGFQFKGDQTKAAKAFATGVAAARSKDDKEHAAEGLYEAGLCYVRMERELEAALVFDQAIRLFPDTAFGAKSATYAVDYLLKAQKGMKDGAVLKPLVDHAQSYAVTAGTGLNAQKILFNQAKSEEDKGSFEQAAQIYDRIEETYEEAGKVRPIPFYGQAKAKVGDCYYKQFQQSKNPDHLKQAREKLEAALTWATEKDDPQTRAQATYFLARVLADPAGESASEAARVVDETFDSIAEQWDNRALARAIQVDVLCRLGNAAVAAEKLADIQSCVDAGAASGASAYRIAVLSLLRHYEAKSQEKQEAQTKMIAQLNQLREARQKMREADRIAMQGHIRSLQGIYDKVSEEHLSLAKDAARFAKLWVEGNANLDVNVRGWIAAVLFIGEEYEAAATHYEALIAAKPQMTADQQAGLTVARLNLAVCYSKAGRLPEAIAELDALNQEVPNEYMVLQERANAKFQLYLNKLESGSKDTVLLEGAGGAIEALNEYYTLFSSIGPSSYSGIIEIFPMEEKNYEVKKFQIIYKLYLAKFYAEKYQEVATDIEFHKKWGELNDLPRELSGRFEELLTKAKSKFR